MSADKLTLLEHAETLNAELDNKILLATEYMPPEAEYMPSRIKMVYLHGAGLQHADALKQAILANLSKKYPSLGALDLESTQQSDDTLIAATNQALEIHYKTAYLSSLRSAGRGGLPLSFMHREEERALYDSYQTQAQRILEKAFRLAGAPEAEAALAAQFCIGSLSNCEIGFLSHSR